MIHFVQKEEDDEYYWHDLIGCDVLNEQEQTFGKVTALMETGAHDVLQVAENGRTLFIPFVEPYVVDVQLDRRRIVVMWQLDWSE